MSNNNDERVLNAILNPNTPFVDPKQVDILLQQSKYENSDESIKEAKQLELEGIIRPECKGVKAAERNDLAKSLELFGRAVERAPHWASGYNNRAQALRLSGNVDGSKPSSSSMSVDELNELHRKEKKELQVKIQTLKKSVTKGDKKKKKEVDAEIEKLEKDFEAKCKMELEKMAAGETTVKSPASCQVVEEESHQTEETMKPVVKMSKAQKRKEKKEKHEIERESEIARQEVENQKGPAALELKSIESKLAKKGLRVKDVKSDGNCMYYAISDQLARHKSMSREWRQLRQETCDYMLANPDQFQPYLTSEQDDDDLIDADKYKEYCEKVRDTLVWGGHLELKALADIFNVLIEVVQGGQGAELVIGEPSSSSKEKLIITYHRHMFGTGEHYNSTEPLPPPSQHDDDE